MKDEVEAFLRRVAQMRAQAEAQAKAKAERVAPQVAPPRPPQQSTSPKQANQPKKSPAPQRPPRRQQQEPVEAEVVTGELRQRDAVSRHVSQHLSGAEAIGEHARHLGEEVDLADDKLNAHLHEVFDHQLGQFANAESNSGDRPAAASNSFDIFRLLRSPQSVRDALIMSEVLRRPEHNW